MKLKICITLFVLFSYTSCNGNPVGESVVSLSDDTEEQDDFKYPTTPHSDPSIEVPTGIPDLPDDVNNGQVKIVNGPVIVGNKSCQCGTPLKSHKIVGGEAVPISELPWTVALVRKRNTTIRGPYCGATLVSNRYLVTAAHCCDGFDAKKIEAWLNEEDFRVDDENLSGTIRIDIEEIIMHPEYNSKSITNDIALLKLAKPVDIENTIPPACLPADNSETYDGEQAIVAGWGAKESGGSVSATLQKVTVPIITNFACNWRTLYLGRITDSQLCAGELTMGMKDSCQGDSGGPLVVSRGEKSQKMLVGVVSYGYGCALKFAPGVYTRTSSYPQWIIENSKDADYCSS